ncbi:MAG: hypothetical protein K9G48_12770 [Reyranella sp.]|nr:hypothetical protein [Reyranella sp.]
MMLLVEHGEGHAVEISGLKGQVAQLVHENTLLTIGATEAKETASEAIKQAADIGRELATVSQERDTERRRRVALEIDLRRAEETAIKFPLLIDKGHFVYVGLADASHNIGGASDDAGDYQNAGNFPDYAALVAAPLNPRTYATCALLNMIRLPAAPAGTLRVDDDIPF